MNRVKRVLLFFVWNMFMAAVVFLPVFLIGVNIELLIVHGDLAGKDLVTILLEIVFMFIALIAPVLLASIIFSLCGILIPMHWLRQHYRLKAGVFSVAITLLIVVSLVLLDVNVAAYFLSYLVPTIVAAACYGLVAKFSEQ